MTRPVAVITGTTHGIGTDTSLGLAGAGYAVVMLCRNVPAATALVVRIVQQIPGSAVQVVPCDLASLASVRAAAREVRERYPRIDRLINNAGIVSTRRRFSVDGHELTFATNYLGPFLLTALLYSHLKPCPGTRIVTVSSGVTNQGKIEFDNLQSERVYKPMFGAYSQSKLADLIFQLELQRRLSAAGSPILSTGAHPGYALTNLQTSGPAGIVPLSFRLVEIILKPLASQDAAHGALPTLFAATSPVVTPGGYYGPTTHFPMSTAAWFAGLPPGRISMTANGTKNGSGKRISRFARRSTAPRCTKRSWGLRRPCDGFLRRLARSRRRIPRF